MARFTRTDDGYKGKVPVILYLDVRRILALKSVLKAHGDAFVDIDDTLEASLKYAMMLERGSQTGGGKLNPSKCKYCNKNIVWMNGHTYEAVLPAKTTPLICHIEFELHRCEEYLKAQEETKKGKERT
jgi:hypothetical protein